MAYWTDAGNVTYARNVKQLVVVEGRADLSYKVMHVCASASRHH